MYVCICIESIDLIILLDYFQIMIIDYDNDDDEFVDYEDSLK